MTRGMSTSGAWPASGSIHPSPASSVEAGGAVDEFPSVSIDVPFKVLREQWNDHLERTYLRALLDRFGRADVGALAEAASLDRSYVHRLLRKHGL